MFKRISIALGMVTAAAVFTLFIDAITTSLLAFVAVVVIFAGFLLAVGLFAPVKRNQRGHIL